jgi:hypothetical protein
MNRLNIVTDVKVFINYVLVAVFVNSIKVEI